MPVDIPFRAGSAKKGAIGDSTSLIGRHVIYRGTAISRSFLTAASSLAGTVAVGSPAAAQDMIAAVEKDLSLSTVEIVQAAIFAGVIGSALVCAVILIRERMRITRQNEELRARLADVNADLMRSEALLNLRDQRIVVWADDDEKPKLLGSLPPESGAPEDRSDFLAFGRWLAPRSAGAIDRATAALRKDGQAFDLVVETHKGAPFEVQGRRNASHTFLRFVSMSEAQRATARLTLDNQRLSADFDTVMRLMENVETPFWIRGADGRQRWVNRAYARAVEAQTPGEVLSEGRELFGTGTRETVISEQRLRPVYTAEAATVVEGDRRTFVLTDVAGDGASAGMAIDVSALNVAREQAERTERGHADTLDRLTTAVASFDSRQRLVTYNRAFQQLWDLDDAFLRSKPDHTLLLDRLRSDGKIDETRNWREWKDGILKAYIETEPSEDDWHLPDRRTLHVFANPQPGGGVTWVFDDQTEKVDLESRYKTAVRVQGETLDNLAEGVAVFGADGRIRLSNPSFLRLWGLNAEQVTDKMHINQLAQLCGSAVPGDVWTQFVDVVTGFDSERDDKQGQIELKNGSVLHYAAVHLPNGQVMLTFVDVTDSVNVERALQDKNDALQRADEMKNRFLQHVSYELRSPLTNIIGFSELMTMPNGDPLTPRQREYVGHISTSSAILLTVVNDILDLATVDAGVMQLEIGEVNVGKLLKAAADTVAERLTENKVTLEINTEHAPAQMRGDGNRIRQVLANLLANAANFAPSGSAILLTCRSVEDGTAFIIHDDGPGIPPDVIENAFGAFESKINGGRRRGAGLGLAIVKGFVELHGGRVSIETGEGKGTTVSCVFPSKPLSGGQRDAAE